MLHLVLVKSKRYGIGCTKEASGCSGINYLLKMPEMANGGRFKDF